MAFNFAFLRTGNYFAGFFPFLNFCPPLPSGKNLNGAVTSLEQHDPVRFLFTVWELVGCRTTFLQTMGACAAEMRARRNHFAPAEFFPCACQVLTSRICLERIPLRSTSIAGSDCSPTKVSKHISFLVPFSPLFSQVPLFLPVAAGNPES